MTTRRDVVTLLGGAAATWPLPVGAQQRERVRSVGVLTPFAAHNTEGQNRVTAFAQALQQLGWSAGQNALLHYRWGDGTSATMQKYAAELVALAPDVILADSTQSCSR
jgi:putative ABC transport system substrate-binding protein